MTQTCLSAARGPELANKPPVPAVWVEKNNNGNKDREGGKPWTETREERSQKTNSDIILFGFFWMHVLHMHSLIHMHALVLSEQLNKPHLSLSLSLSAPHTNTWQCYVIECAFCSSTSLQQNRFYCYGCVLNTSRPVRFQLQNREAFKYAPVRRVT